MVYYYNNTLKGSVIKMEQIKSMYKMTYERFNKVKNLVFSIGLCVGKSFFWVIFACLFLLQMLSLLIMWEDYPSGIDNSYQITALYIFLTLCCMVSLFMCQKFFIYMSAFSIMILFLYSSSLPGVSLYFNYFAGLD